MKYWLITVKAIPSAEQHYLVQMEKDPMEDESFQEEIPTLIDEYWNTYSYLFEDEDYESVMEDCDVYSKELTEEEYKELSNYYDVYD